MSTPTEGPAPTPEQDAQVRRLLAEARHDEPMPPEVVARLDGVLAGLSRERAAATEVPARPPAPVADLAVRRRRRVAGLLVAAAAVVVAGVGLQQALQGTGEGSALGSADSAGPAVRPAGSPPETASPQRERAYAAARPARLHPATFRADVARLRHRQRLAGTSATVDEVPGASARSALSARDRAVSLCAPRQAGPGARVPVRYAGQPAVLVVRAPAGGRQVVDLYPCGGASVQRSVTLPAR